MPQKFGSTHLFENNGQMDSPVDNVKSDYTADSCALSANRDFELDSRPDFLYIEKLDLSGM